MSIQTFAADVAKWAEIAGINGTDVMEKIGQDAYAGLLLRSPVKEGRFRGSWRIGINKLNGYTLPKGEGGHSQGTEFKDPPNGSETLYMLERTSKIKWADELIISNSLPYAKRLEDGYSKQNGHRPNGILGDAFDELTSGLERSIKNATMGR